MEKIKNYDIKIANGEEKKRLEEVSKLDKDLNKYITYSSKTPAVLFLYDNEVIGFYSVANRFGNPEIQGAILKEYRNQGHGKELLRTATEQCMTPNNQKIYLSIKSDNLASINVAKEIGYYRDYDFEDRELDDNITYSMLNPLYQSKREK